MSGDAGAGPSRGGAGLEPEDAAPEPPHGAVGQGAEDAAPEPPHGAVGQGAEDVVPESPHGAVGQAAEEVVPESLRGAAVAWDALGGDPALLARLSSVVREETLPARLPVRALARSCVGVCALAAAELAALRTGRDVPHARVDDGSVAAAFTSERQLLVNGRAPESFAPLSRFWRTADGWVRTHANYPHHRARLLAALDLDGDASVARVGARLAELPAAEAEEAVYAAGGLAVALRTPQEWAAHPQGAAVAGLPLVGRERLGGPSEVPPPTPLGAPGDAHPLLPAAGLRVLDLTRVIAGPVATRTLALLGADVLRVDPPHLPELPDQHADTGFGKRSTTLDLGVPADRRAFADLLARADVVVTGYRPGTLDRFGLAPEALAERRPGLVVAQLSAWGTSGPWSGRRGFDSLVQVATGIAAVEGAPEAPGALPAQALDHGTGYLLTAAVLRSLSERLAEGGDGTSGGGGTTVVRLALARTAGWLTGWPTYAADPWLTGMDGPLGRLRYALPPVAFADGPVNWERPPGGWGADGPVWR